MLFRIWIPLSILMPWITPLLKSRESSYGEFIFKVDSQKMPELTQKLASLVIFEQQIEVADTSLVNKSLATEEEILQSKKEKNWLTWKQEEISMAHLLIIKIN